MKYWWELRSKSRHDGVMGHFNEWSRGWRTYLTAARRDTAVESLNRKSNCFEYRAEPDRESDGPSKNLSTEKGMVE